MLKSYTVKKVISFLIILILLNHSFVFGQKTLTTKIILKNNNDTLTEKLRVITNIFWPNLLNELSVNQRIVVIDSLNKKRIIKAIDIKKMSFVDFKQKERTFIGVFWGKYDKTLKELLYDGKIKWYREYNSNAYDGSIMTTDIMLDEKNEIVRIGLLNSKKNKLKEITKSKPELIESIENTKLTDDNVLMILKKYDE